MRNKLVSIVLVLAMLVSTIVLSIGSITSNAADNDMIIDVSSDSVTLILLSTLTNENVIENIDSFTEEQLSSVLTLHLMSDLNIEGLSTENLSYVVSKLPNLNELICYDSKSVTNLDFIEGCTTLTYINAKNCAITDISVLASCPYLIELDFSDNNITDISALDSCIDLRNINFENNNISDISSFLEIKDENDYFSFFDYINFKNNNISDITGLKEFISMNVDVTNSGFYIYLNGNPLDDQVEYMLSLIEPDKHIHYLSDSTVYDSDFSPSQYIGSRDYDNLVVDNTTRTITVTSLIDASYVTINKYSKNHRPNNPGVKGTTSIALNIDEVKGEVEEKNDSFRYKIYRPEDSTTYTTMVNASPLHSGVDLDPVDYTLVVNFVQSLFSAEKLKIKHAENVAYDSDTNILTMDATSPNITNIYKVLSNGVKLSIDLEKYGFITEYDNFYRVNRAKLDEADPYLASFDITTSQNETINATVSFENFAPKFESEELTVKHAENVTYDAEAKSLTMDATSPNITNIYKVLGNGVKLSIDLEKYGFITEYDNFYRVNRAKLDEANPYLASFDITTNSKETINATVNFENFAPKFESEELTVKHAENVTYDAEAKSITMDATSPNITNIYKKLGNGVKLSIDLEKYDFITEYENFYRINRAMLKASDLNIASFEITTDSGETIKAAVNFAGAGNLPFNMFTISKCSEISQDGTTITLDIAEGYKYSCVYKAVDDGSTLTIESDSAFVEEREDRYVLRAAAAGEQITLTYGGVEYTVNLIA